MARVARLIPLLFLFLLVMFLTESAYLGDTGRYISEIMNHRAHLLPPSQDIFWDFGHPIWRPLVNAVFTIAGPAVQSMRGCDPQQAMAWLMFAITAVSTFAAFLLLWSFLERHSNVAAAWIAAAAFLCTNAVLDYSRSGSSYIPGVCCLILSLWLIQSSRIWKTRAAALGALAGIYLGLSVLFWFPLVLATPAALVYALYRPIQRKTAVLLVLFCALTGALTYAAVIHQRQIHSMADLKNWVQSSRNEVAQTDKLKRAVSGIPRSFLDLGEDTLLLKRYIFHDPYTKVTMRQILLAPGTLKLALFYLYAAGMLLVLWKVPEGRRVLLLLLAVAVPVLVFAVMLFEPGGTEKYFPAYPFFFLGAAVALAACPWRMGRALMAAFLLVVLCGGNIYAKAAWRRAADYRAFRQRKDALDAQAQPGSMVAVINFWDPIYRVPALRLLDSQAQPRNLWVYDVIETASARVLRWRQEFAENAQAHWAKGEQVWIAKRLLADTPQPEWRWIEGDTGRVTWRELTTFFRSFDIAAQEDGSDGFVLLANNPENQQRMRDLAPGPSSPVP